MTFEELISFCDPITVSGSASDLSGKLCQDSRNVKPGDIFIAIYGHQVDGHHFVETAITNGAAVVIIESDVAIHQDVAVIKVQNTRSLLSPLAQKLAGEPAKELTVIGITGTNGKTTVATLVWQLLKKMDRKSALLGTNSKIIDDEKLESRLTTSDPIELATDMKLAVEKGCEYLVMEVSSHALHQKRVNGIPFEVAAFTNLSLDHLDYHSTMDEYAAAKKVLFDKLPSTSWAVVNADDHYAGYMVEDTAAKILDFSFKGKGLIGAEIERYSASKTELNVEGVHIETPLIGRFNAYNVVQALMICTALGFDGKTIADLMIDCTGAEGRMEKVNPRDSLTDKPLVIVDYAHTPDALKNVASTLSDLKQPGEKLLVVFGCGGDRDKSKRPEMAKIAEKYADEVIVTSDNPRTEDPDQIIEDIKTGFSEGYSFKAITSRKEAIQTAIKESDEQTIILIAGKGHETYQEINGIRSHFDDREEARNVLSGKNGHYKNSEVN